MSTVVQVHQAERTQHDFSVPIATYAQNVSTVNPTAPRPQIDATDRRQIEALNEDKSHTTKEALDDIKRTYDQEKNKKEQNDIELYQTGRSGGALVRHLSI